MIRLYCELKINVYYSHLQNYRTTQSTRPNCCTTRYCL